MLLIEKYEIRLVISDYIFADSTMTDECSSTCEKKNVTLHTFELYQDGILTSGLGLAVVVNTRPS